MTTRDKPVVEETPRRAPTLTPGERRVVAAILAGHTTHRAIAVAIAAEESTAGQHLMHIYRKAGAVNMSAVILMVAGITPCGPALSEARRRWRRKHYQIDAAA